MKPDQFIIGIVLFLTTLAFLGGIIIKGSSNYAVTPSDSFSESLTGNNYTEYLDKVEEIQVSAEDDGFLAQFKLAKAVYNVVTSSFGQVKALMTNLATYLHLPAELVVIFIVVIILAAIFGGLYLIIN